MDRNTGAILLVDEATSANEAEQPATGNSDTSQNVARDDSTIAAEPRSEPAPPATPQATAESLGSHALKGLDGPEQIFSLAGQLGD